MVLPESEAVHQIFQTRLAINRKYDAVGSHRAAYIVLPVHRLHAEIPPAGQYHGSLQRIAGTASSDCGSPSRKRVHRDAH